MLSGSLQQLTASNGEMQSCGITNQEFGLGRHLVSVVTFLRLFFRSMRPSAYKVYMGIQSEKGAEQSKQIRDLEKIVKGPPGTDIALLKLDT